MWERQGLYAFSYKYVFVDVLKTHQYEIVINKNPAAAVLKKASKYNIDQNEVLTLPIF